MKVHPKTNISPQLTETKIAVVGYGYWGQKLAATLSKLNQKVFLVDPAKLTLESKFKQLTWSEVLADKSIKGIVIATPEITHAGLTKAAVEVGKAVLVEKPAATKFSDWQEITQFANQHEIPVVVDYTFLQSQALKKWQELVKNYQLKLGKLNRLISTRQSPLSLAKIEAKKLPIWWDVAIHDIYLIKAVWQAKLTDWQIVNFIPNQKVKLLAKFNEVELEANYGWVGEPIRFWQAEYEFGKLIWQRDNGQEKIQLYLADKLLVEEVIADVNPSPIDGVILGWLRFINQPKFDCNYWQNYWQSVAADIKTISDIDVVYQLTSKK